MFSLFFFIFLLLGVVLDLFNHGNDRKYVYFFIFNLVLRITSLFLIILQLIVVIYWLWDKNKDK